MTIAVCPGSYDPVTAGHLDVIERSARFFDEVHVVVAVNAAKTPMFSEATRVDVIRRALDKAVNHQVVTAAAGVHGNGISIIVGAIGCTHPIDIMVYVDGVSVCGAVDTGATSAAIHFQVQLRTGRSAVSVDIRVVGHIPMHMQRIVSPSGDV